MSDSDGSSPDIADRVDEALAQLWRGRTDEFDRILDQEERDGGPGVGALLGGWSNVDASELTPPKAVADYEILGELGRGGMGVVYEARQKHPERLVALKVIRGGPFVDEYRVRSFQREVQTLARLRHPNIAAIYDAGRTGEGQHFFAMELVHGVTLTEYARSSGQAAAMSGEAIQRRLRVFLEVCDAISYAHQRGVIHRDLKPSNIVVGESPSETATRRPVGDVKVLDFGLARITDADLAAVTITTDSEKIRGTLAYMSPEQASGDGNDIDIRSDVYSLGVILYELLTGRLPHDLKHRPVVEAVRALQEEEPVRPGVVNARLRGDLETILLKALAKKPADRYQSAAALGEDLQRYLGHQPILARPPSAMYQLKKLMARHRAWFASGVMVLVVIVGALIAVTSLYVETRSARVAEAEQRQVAERVSGFLTGMLASIDPRKTPDADTTLVHELLDEASARVKTELGDQPRVRMPIESTIGQVYHGLGMYEKSYEHMTVAHALSDEYLGEADATSLAVSNNLAITLQDLGRLDEAEALFRRTLELGRRAHGNEHPQTIESINDLGNLCRERNEFDEAEPLLREAVALRTKILGPEDPLTLVAINNLVNVLSLMKEYDEAEPLIRELLAVQERVLPEEHPDLLVTINDMAVVLRSLGRLDEAEGYLRRAVAGFRRVSGERHMDTMITTFNLADLQRRLGHYQEAADALGRLVETADEALPEGHYLPGAFRNGLALALKELGRYEEAEATAKRAYEQLLSALDAKHPYVHRSLEILVEVCEASGRGDAAERYRALLEAGEDSGAGSE